MGNANALSHLPLENASKEHDGSALLVECQNLPITAKMIGHATKQDPVLSCNVQSLVTGYNNPRTGKKILLYINVWLQMSVVQGCMLRGAS